jgi:hypothetical protein
MTALVTLTAVVWMIAVHRRVAEIRHQRIGVQSLARAKDTVALLQDTQAMDNLNNLLQMPVLFYVVCLAGMLVDTASTLMVVMAWVYVLLRVAHSLIQLGHNKVMHRFAVWMASNAVLFAVWGCLVWAQV